MKSGAFQLSRVLICSVSRMHGLYYDDLPLFTAAERDGALRYNINLDRYSKVVSRIHALEAVGDGVITKSDTFLISYHTFLISYPLLPPSPSSRLHEAGLKLASVAQRYLQARACTCHCIPHPLLTIFSRPLQSRSPTPKRWPSSRSHSMLPRKRSQS